MPADNTSEIEFTEEQKQLISEKDISEDEVGECISREMEENDLDQDQAVAICLSKLEAGSSEPSKTDSLENPEFDVGDFVEWEFGSGSSQGEIIDMTAEVGDSMSAGGNEFTVEEGDGPLYKIEEWDESEGDDGEFTNNVVKFEDALNNVERPEAAERSKSYSKSKIEEYEENGRQMAFKVNGKDAEVKQENSDGDVVVNIPIQALSEDRDGDFINEKGQESIIRQLKSGTVPLMPNHGIGKSNATYGFEDIFGQFVNGDNRQGTTIGTARLLPENEFSEKLIKLLENDMPVGFSVGFIPTEKEPRDKGEGDGMEISDLDLMEVSAVGIPSNPDAVPQASADVGKALAKAVDAGVSKKSILDRVEKALNDTMTDKQSSNGQGENSEEKSDGEKQSKQLDEGDIEMVMGIVSDTLDRHMEAAMEDIQSDLMNDEDIEEDEMDEEDEETDEMDEDEDDEEEMNQSSEEPDEQDGASDHNEDSEKSESAESEEKETEGLSDEEKTVTDDSSQGKTITEYNDEDSGQKSEDDSKTVDDPFAVR